MSDDKQYKGEIDRMRRPERLQLLEIQRVVDLCLSGIEVQSVLDVGTGSAVWAEAFAQRHLSIAGLDVRADMLATARGYVPDGDFREGTAENLPFDADQFDLVFMGHVLHETSPMRQALEEARRVAAQRVAVLEWSLHKATDFGPPLDHRLAPDQVRLMASQAGFSRIDLPELAYMDLYLLNV